MCLIDEWQMVVEERLLGAGFETVELVIGVMSDFWSFGQNERHFGSTVVVVVVEQQQLVAFEFEPVVVEVE